MRIMLYPLRGIGQKRQRELHLGSGRAGDDARLCSNDDAVCAVHLLRCRIGFCGRCRSPDLYQDEHRRGRRDEVDRIATGRVPFYYRGLDRVPGHVRLPDIGGNILEIRE